MKIPFESWLADQAVDPDSKSLFTEALLCYQARAYRAALVFSYLAFLRLLAGRLMNTDQPSSFSQSFWPSLQRRIRDDTTWEPAVFDAAVQAQPAPVFLIDDDVRQQLRYWRARRNDAAHSKGNQISYAHVEMLWLFIQSNWGRFVVNGGPLGLMELFRRHYDPTYTPINADCSELVRQIPQSVPPHELRDFLRELLAIPVLNEFDYRIPDLSMSPSEGLIDNLERLGDPRVMDALAAELKSHPDLFMAVLLDRPSFVLYYAGDAGLLRDLWYEKLTLSKITYFNELQQGLKVIAVMLRNDLIPRALHETVMDHVIGRIRETDPRPEYPPDLLNELEPFGFWAVVRRHAFGQFGNIEWGARNLELALAFIERHAMDRAIAEFFCDLFPEQITEWEGYDWIRKTRLQEPEDLANLNLYFSMNPALYHEIVRVAREHKLRVEPFETLMAPERMAATAAMLRQSQGGESGGS